MKYVMADIHGDYDKYVQMLGKIHLKETDELYVLGDVIDRGPDGMKILKDMMMRPNVIPILGNHEYMASIALPWLLQEVTDENIEDMSEDIMQGLIEWMNVGGEATIAEFHRLSHEEQQDILDYLMEFQLYDEVEAGGKQFVLVHAGLQNFSQEKQLEDYKLSELLFQRPDYEKTYFQDKYLVTGHTPVKQIYVKNNHVAIDCGCGYGGKLGCVCLDTLEKFYV